MRVRVPYKRIGLFIALIQVVQHCLLKCWNRPVSSVPDASFGHFGKQSFHKIQPTATHGREMGMVTGVVQQTRSHLIDLAGSVVIHHQVDIKTCWEVRVNVIEEPQQLLMAVPSVATAESDSASDIQSRE
jgi:hypothetical protein